MNENKEYEIILADYDWSATEHVVADASLFNGRVEIVPRDGMYIEEIDSLKHTIRNKETRFQAEGFPAQDSVPDKYKTLIGPNLRLNKWRYIIKEK